MIAVALAVLISARMFLGPFTLLLPVNAPINAEGLFGITCTVLLLAARRSATDESKDRYSIHRMRWAWWIWASVAAFTIASFVQSFSLYFLSDDFIVVRMAAFWIPEHLRALFTAGAGDGFFRPIGGVSLALDSIWASFDPVRWHVAGLALHLVNTILVGCLALSLGATRRIAAFAAMLFGIHGTRPEAVVWIAARFDLLATLFVLAGLLAFIRAYRREGYESYVSQVGALACMVLAVWSKESAYVFPLLALLCSFWIGQGKIRLMLIVPYFLLAVVLLAHRWTLFHGIGGYGLVPERGGFSGKR